MRDFLYNKEELNKEEKRFLIFIERDIKKLLEIYKEDEEMSNLVNDVSKLKDDKDFIIEYDRAAYERAVYEYSAREEGIEQGEHQANTLTAKKMLIKNKPLEEIEEFTGLSHEEINALKAELN